MVMVLVLLVLVIFAVRMGKMTKILYYGNGMSLYNLLFLLSFYLWLGSIT